MSRNIRGRLERLERHAEPEAGGLPALFWEAISGQVPLAELPKETRRIVEPLFARPAQTGADRINALIAGVGGDVADQPTLVPIKPAGNGKGDTRG
jgi:hypothetical protein